MFLIPRNVDILISWNSDRIAYSNPMKNRIVVGRHFLVLPEDQQSAIILHESAHLRLGHTAKRMKWLFKGKWRKLSELAHQQEFEADAVAAKYGHAPAMIDFLTHWPAEQSAFHPSTEERIARLEDHNG